MNTTLRVVYSYHDVIQLKKGVNCVNFAVSIIPCKERLKGQLWRSHALLITLLWNKETDKEKNENFEKKRKLQGLAGKKYNILKVLCLDPVCYNGRLVDGGSLLYPWTL